MDIILSILPSTFAGGTIALLGILCWGFVVFSVFTAPAPMPTGLCATTQDVEDAPKFHKAEFWMAIIGAVLFTMGCTIG